MDDELAVRLDPRQRRLRLEIRLVDPAGAEPAGHDHVGALEPGGGVAAPDPLAHGHVRRVSVSRRLGRVLGRRRAGGLALVTGGRAGVRARGALVVARRGRDAHERRVGGQRGLQIEYGRERVGVDDDERGAVLGRGLGFGDHERNRLAGPHDLLARERLRGAAGTADERQIRGGEHRDDARQIQRRAAVDARDPGVRLGGQHRPRVQQPVHRHVGDVARRPAHLRVTVAATARRSDHPTLLAKWYDVIRIPWRK